MQFRLIETQQTVTLRFRGFDVDCASIEVAARELETAMVTLLPRLTRTFTFLHAGVVVRGGMATLFAGASSSGKTTLSRAMLGYGYGYFSDDVAPISDGGLVQSFPKPLAIQHQDRSITLEDPPYEAVSDLAEAPVELVICTWFDPAARWAPERLSPAQGLQELLRHLFEAPTEGDLERLDRICRTVPVLRGPRNDAATTAQAIAGGGPPGPSPAR